MVVMCELCWMLCCLAAVASSGCQEQMHSFGSTSAEKAEQWWYPDSHRLPNMEQSASSASMAPALEEAEGGGKVLWTRGRACPGGGYIGNV